MTDMLPILLANLQQSLNVESVISLSELYLQRNIGKKSSPSRIFAARACPQPKSIYLQLAYVQSATPLPHSVDVYKVQIFLA